MKSGVQFHTMCIEEHLSGDINPLNGYQISLHIPEFTQKSDEKGNKR